MSEDLKGRLQDIIEATPNTADRSCLQQVLALLESWECRSQDSATAVSTPAEFWRRPRINQAILILPVKHSSDFSEGSNMYLFFFGGGGSTNSVEDRENGDLGT